MPEENQNIKKNIEEELDSLANLLEKINSISENPDEIAENPQKLVKLGETHEQAKNLILDICGLYCIYTHGLKGPNPDEKKKAVRKASGDLFSSSIREAILKTTESTAGYYINSPHSEEQVEEMLNNYKKFRKFHEEARKWMRKENNSLYDKAWAFFRS